MVCKTRQHRAGPATGQAVNSPLYLIAGKGQSSALSVVATGPPSLAADTASLPGFIILGTLVPVTASTQGRSGGGRTQMSPTRPTSVVQPGHSVCDQMPCI